MTDWGITRDWTLFLDRDGVLNELLPGNYVKHVGEWKWREGVLDSLTVLRKQFNYIFIITNQQGIGKGIMSALDLAIVHAGMNHDLKRVGVELNGVYYAPYLVKENHPWRKPGTGMLEGACKDHPEVDPTKSIFVGDSASDLKAGKAFGAKTVGISPYLSKFDANITDFCTPNLPTFTSYIEKA